MSVILYNFPEEKLKPHFIFGKMHYHPKKVNSSWTKQFSTKCWYVLFSSHVIDFTRLSWRKALVSFSLYQDALLFWKRKKRFHHDQSNFQMIHSSKTSNFFLIFHSVSNDLRPWFITDFPFLTELEARRQASKIKTFFKLINFLLWRQNHFDQ